jgi:recombination protein RecT
MKTSGGLAKKQQEIKQEQEKQLGLRALIAKMEPEIKKALPSVITPERFTRMVFTALSTNPQLLSCTPGSFLGSMMQAAQLGLEPNTPLGQAYLIPYKNHGNMECQFQLGYKGLIDLVYRSEEVTDIQAHEVYENDEFEYELGLSPKLKHIPALKDRGEVIMYYAVFHTKNGGYGFEVMSKDDVKSFAAKTSQAYASSYSPWKKYFDEMAKKTVLKKALKYAPLKTDFVRQIKTDESVKSSISADMTDLPDEKMVTIDADTQTDANESFGQENDVGEEIPWPGNETPAGVDPETGEVK